jgi:hypothetical protein
VKQISPGVLKGFNLNLRSPGPSSPTGYTDDDVATDKGMSPLSEDKGSDEEDGSQYDDDEEDSDDEVLYEKTKLCSDSDSDLDSNDGASANAGKKEFDDASTGKEEATTSSSPTKSDFFAPKLKTRQAILKARKLKPKKKKAPAIEKTTAEKAAARKRTANAKLAQVAAGETLAAVEEEADWLKGAWKFLSGTSAIWKQDHFRLTCKKVRGKMRVRSICVRCGAHYAKQSGNPLPPSPTPPPIYNIYNIYI